MSNLRLSPPALFGVALVVTVGLMAIFVMVAASAMGGPYGGSYGMMGGGSWGWAILMMGLPAGFLVLVLAIILGGLREPVTAATSDPSATPLEILAARYARSEISADEFCRIRDDLAGSATRQP